MTEEFTKENLFTEKQKLQFLVDYLRTQIVEVESKLAWVNFALENFDSVLAVRQKQVEEKERQKHWLGLADQLRGPNVVHEEE